MSDSTEETPKKEKTAPAPSPRKTWAIRIGLGTVLLVALIWGICVLIHSYYYESTDDAFVEGHVVTISTKLSNIVRDVLIDDNYEVKKGQLLVQIDPRDYEVQLHSAQASYDKAQSDYLRNLALANSSAISKQDLDTTHAAFDVTSAQLDQAKLNLEYTRITAPVAGRITRKNVEPGDYIQTSQTLFSIVPHDIWIIANFKETQLTHMLPGQPATIRIDAFPGKVFKGHVDSLQSGTGARFSLLPPENATGNYVKVVQRVPVKILFDEPPEVQAAFAPGLSVVPEVNISVVPGEKPKVSMAAAASADEGGAFAGAAARPRVYNPWIIAVVVTMATFMELLDTTIANVALPHIAGGLSSGIDESTWILTSYLVANAVVLPLSAWLSRYFGRKRYYMACVALFTISSFMCGLAPSLGLLIFFRVLQGIGGGGLAPCEQAILVDTFPPAKRSAAFALYSMAIVTAPAIGPTLGGYITDHFNWRWVFYINVPIGLLSLFLSNLVVTDSDRMKKEMKETRESGAKIDFIGILLVAVAFGCLEVVLDKGQRDDWFESNFILTFFVVSMIALIAGIWWELTVEDPVVDLTLLRERNFTLANFFYFMFGFTLIGSTVLIPQMLQGLFGYTAYQSGWAISPAAIVVVCLAPLVVKFLFPKFGAAPLIGASFLIQAFALWHYSQLDLEADYASFVRCRLIQGFGVAFLFIPVSGLAYSYLAKELNNKASSLTNLFRNLGSSFGIAFVTTMQARRMQVHQNFLVEHLSVGDPAVLARLHAMSNQFVHGGYTSVDAPLHAQALLAFNMSNQASILGFLDVFWILGWISAGSALFVLFIRPFDSHGGPPAGD